ncbi:hypothetical protein PO909_009233, partial [Leuciscus waleckii]
MVSYRLYCTLWILLCFGQYFGQDLQFPEPANGAVGESVVLAPDNPPSTSFLVTQWTLIDSTLIIRVVSGVTTVNSSYEGRVRFDINTLALELQNLRLGDSGIYRLSVTTSAGEILTGETSLQVFGQYFGQDLQFPEPANGAVGESVVLAPDNPPSTSFLVTQWTFNSIFIIIVASGVTTVTPAYEDRVSFDINTLALELQNLRLGDSGIYTLSVTTSAGEILTGETSLQVF